MTLYNFKFNINQNFTSFMHLFWIFTTIMVSLVLNLQLKQSKCFINYNRLFSKQNSNEKNQMGYDNKFESFLTVSQQSEFSLQNIPFGVFSTLMGNKKPCTRIGDWIIDLQQIEKAGLFNKQLFKNLKQSIFSGQNLNEFISLQRSIWKEVRTTIQELFLKGSNLQFNQQLLSKILYHLQDCIMHLPCDIGDFTDFYSSKNHAFNIGSIIRGPQNALNANWFHIPIAYHGRSSSIVISGTNIRRPRGQIKSNNQNISSFQKSKKVDFQVQIAAFIGGKTNELGKPIKVNQAWNNIFGFVLLNDWSFRDLQTWQYVPLGPFTSKNGITTISPWIVTLQALQDSKVQLQQQNPTPLKYLQQKQHYSYDIRVSTSIKTNHMLESEIISVTNFKYLYWSCAQQLAHHTVSGCKMRPGDLLGSGTISGATKQSLGSIFEMTKGENPILLKNKEMRIFLEDQDTITIKGYALKNGKKIGFGECVGKVIPALQQTEYF